eukprot:gene28553-37513_t
MILFIYCLFIHTLQISSAELMETEWKNYFSQGLLIESKGKASSLTAIFAPTSPSKAALKKSTISTTIQSCSTTYTVVSGDTCTTIGIKYGVSAAAIISANSATVNSICTNLQIGQVLCIPASTTAVPVVSPVTAPGTQTFPVVGFFNQEFSSGGWPAPYGTPNSNMGATFSGHNSLTDNYQFAPQLPEGFSGTKYITVGGGDLLGSWSANVITQVVSDINNNLVQTYGFQGIGIDIEIGDSGLLSNFNTLLQAAKEKELLVFVTVSGNAPYSVEDKCTLMTGLFASPYIDFLVPQLYGAQEGFDGGANDCGWDFWRNTQIPIVPVIWSTIYIPQMNNWAVSNGFDLKGYMVWTPAK